MYILPKFNILGIIMSTVSFFRIMGSVYLTALQRWIPIKKRKGREISLPSKMNFLIKLTNIPHNGNFRLSCSSLSQVFFGWCLQSFKKLKSCIFWCFSGNLANSQFLFLFYGGGGWWGGGGIKCWNNWACISKGIGKASKCYCVFSMVFLWTLRTFDI